MHDALFAHQDSIVPTGWRRFAELANIPDTVAFLGCLHAKDAIAALTRDTSAARLLGVRITPTFLINETRLEGTPPLDTLEAYISRALRGTH